MLKGLLDTGDADAMAAALAERQFLARERLEAEVLESALAWTLASPGRADPLQSPAIPADWNGKILGQRLTERDLQLGLERAYRMLAHLSSRVDERIALVERANSVRPRTLV